MELLRIVFVLLSVKVFCTALSRHPVLLVISFGGFRYDYLNKGLTPTLNALRQNGTRAEYLRNVFPTKTYPNHHSIATGLYPESHGVLGYRVYDNRKKRVYKYSADLYNNPDVTPIWTLNQREGKGRHSGIMLWPGGEFEYKGVKPTFFESPNFSVKWEIRINTVIGWLTDRKTPANLVMMYFERPANKGFAFDPDSERIKNHIKDLDNITRYLLNQLSSKGILYTTNVILLSDHGMESVYPQSIINVTDLIVKNDYKRVGMSPVFQIFPKCGKGNAIYEKLKSASLDCNFKVYRKSEIPDKWHYKGSVRSPPILLVADEGYAFDDMYSTTDVASSSNWAFGLSGYDNSEVNMRPFFFSWGPKVKKNHTVDPFDTVDLYSLFGFILNLTLPNNNGSFANIRSIIRGRR